MLGADAVLTEANDLSRYEDGWRYGKGRALLAVRPGTTEQVSDVMAYCHERGIRVMPQGANTGLVPTESPVYDARMAPARTVYQEPAPRRVTARYPAMFAIDESASIFCARVMRGTQSMAITVA